MADIPGDLSTTSALTVGGSTTSVLDFNGDHDWFAISLVAGQQITISVFGDTLVDPLLNLRNSSGQIITSNDDIKAGSDRNSELTYTPTSSGTYYIDVGAYNDAYNGTYQVSVQPGTTPPLATVDTIAGYLTYGYWGGDIHHFAVTQGGTISVNLSTLNSGEQNLARNALQEWSDIIGVHFQEVTTGGQIVFDNTEDSTGNPVAATDAVWSRGITSSAHVHISSSWVNRYGTNLNSYSFQTYIHEIGHALGLGHAGDYNGSATYSTDALFQNDAWSTSIMSYFDERQNSYFANQGFSRDYAVTPMEADIVAMQTLYGLSTTTRSGDTVYGFHSNAGGMYDATLYPNVALTIFDSGGNDTLDYSLASANQLINLNPETFSNVNGNIGNLTIGRGVVIENAIGGSGADTIIGNSAANVLTGGLGSDTLTGGGGSDTFRDTIAGHNGDKITDFWAGDTLVFSDASPASFSYKLSGTTLTYSGGSMTFGSALSGTLVSSAASGGGVQLTLSSPASTPTAAAVGVHDLNYDFNGDGLSDLLLRDDSGAMQILFGNAQGAFTQGSSSPVATNLYLAATGDFNADGLSDLVWRDQNGQLSIWEAKAGGGFVTTFTSSIAGNSWHIVGTGDFNGDHRSDILWRNDSGQLNIWQSNPDGTFYTSFVSSIAGPSWHVAGTGDFSGDGRDGIIWRNDSGQVNIWEVGSDGVFYTPFTSTIAGNDWHITGTGDFNGDGRTDILWRNDNGQLNEWDATANGSFTTSYSAIVPLNQHVSAIGDFNGDHIDDVAFRDDTGQLTIWHGTAAGGFATSSSMPLALSWHVQDLFT